ncbi:MAG TPA: hypothetical protein VMX75_07285 [Spirochaetia bacterium]|nr:hypothetical protein [Spirochaetia bacterium]
MGARTMEADSPVIEWLLQGDPSIRWQVLRDIVPSLPRQVDREQGRLLIEGWCPKLLSLQDGLGCWGGGLSIILQSAGC